METESRTNLSYRQHGLGLKHYGIVIMADLLCRCGAQVLVSLQETLTESSLIRHRLYSGERHLTLVPNRNLFQ